MSAKGRRAMVRTLDRAHSWIPKRPPRDTFGRPHGKPESCDPLTVTPRAHLGAADWGPLGNSIAGYAPSLHLEHRVPPLGNPERSPGASPCAALYPFCPDPNP
jgi:hypothetical protein